MYYSNSNVLWLKLAVLMSSKESKSASHCEMGLEDVFSAFSGTTVGYCIAYNRTGLLIASIRLPPALTHTLPAVTCPGSSLLRASTQRHKHAPSSAKGEQG